MSASIEGFLQPTNQLSGTFLSQIFPRLLTRARWPLDGSAAFRLWQDPQGQVDPGLWTFLPNPDNATPFPPHPQGCLTRAGGRQL